MGIYFYGPFEWPPYHAVKAQCHLGSLSDISKKWKSSSPTIRPLLHLKLLIFSSDIFGHTSDYSVASFMIETLTSLSLFGVLSGI
jgi:hypothetical protein